MPQAAAQMPFVTQPPMPIGLTGSPSQPVGPVYTVQVAPPPAPLVINEDDVKLVHEMFPNLDVDVIRTILENERGNKDRAINNLLQMTSDS